jgi:uncharacterized Zn-binding protein involved in type VI secretion
MFPIARLGDIRACSASIINTLQTTVLGSNYMPIAVFGSLDSHGGIAVQASSVVFANDIPVIYLTSVNDFCKWVHPPHYCQPLVMGDPFVMVDP